MLRKREAHESRKAPSRLLGLSLTAFAVALIVFLVSTFLAGEPRHAAWASALHDAIPWAVLFGALLLLLHFVVRRAAKAPRNPARRDPNVFDESTSFHDEANPPRR